MEKKLTLSILSENQPGLTNRVTSQLMRRKINILSLSASESEIGNIYRFVIVIKTTRETAEAAAKQIEKLVDVIKVYIHEDDELIHQEVALYKIPYHEIVKNKAIEQIVRQFNARILSVEQEYIVIEKTGHKEETQELFERLKEFGILEFARSGRVMINKSMREFDLNTLIINENVTKN